MVDRGADGIYLFNHFMSVGMPLRHRIPESKVQEDILMGDLPRPAKTNPRPEVPRMHMCEVAPRLVQFEAPLAAVVRGYNRLELSVHEGGPQTVVWLEVAVEP
jgi:hypothetical protein